MSERRRPRTATGRGPTARARGADDQPTGRARDRAASRAARSGPHRRGVGMPAEKSKDFGGSPGGCSAGCGPERLGVVAVLVLAVVSVTLTVFGPKILGHATDIIVDGVARRRRASTSAHCTACCWSRRRCTSASSVLAYLQSYILAGVVQRTMYRLRADVEDKLNRLPLGYVDRQPRGDLLSRVTNDIDNIAQSLQQTLSQMLTSTLTLVGVL